LEGGDAPIRARLAMADSQSATHHRVPPFNTNSISLC
jgi:hypothetical protein